MDNQIDKVYRSFFDSPKTMKEADVETGVMRENITRYVKEFRENGSIRLIRKKYCSVTNHLAGVYTTNPDLFPQEQQLSLDFD